MTEIKRVVCDNVKKIFIMLIGSLILYYSFFVEKLANPDAICTGFSYKAEYFWENALGRVGLQVIGAIKGYNILPYLSTFFALVFLCMSVILICDMVEAKSVWSVVFIATVLIASVHIVNGLTYYYCFDAYMLAMLFDVFAIWYAYRVKGISSWFVPGIMIAMSYTVYQAYISFAMVLCIIIVLCKLLEKESLRDINRLGARFVVAGVAGTGLYLLTVKILAKIGYLVLADGRGFSTMGKLSLRSIPRYFANAYREFFVYYFKNKLILNEWAKRTYINIIFAVIIFAGIIYIICTMHDISKKDRIIRCVGILILISVMPIAFMVEEIIFPEVSIYEPTGMLVLASMNLFYVLGICIVERISIKNKAAEIAVNTPIVITMLALCWVLLVYNAIFQECMANNISVAKNTAYDITYSLEDIPKIESKPVAVIGEPYWGMEKSYNIVSGTVAPYHIAWKTNIYGVCLQNFFRDYCNSSFVFTDFNEAKEVYKNVENMTKYKSTVKLDIYVDEEHVLVVLK